jgi:predicted RNase H-like HicB family nuclease
MARE